MIACIHAQIPENHDLNPEEFRAKVFWKFEHGRRQPARSIRSAVDGLESVTSPEKNTLTNCNLDRAYLDTI